MNDQNSSQFGADIVEPQTQSGLWHCGDTRLGLGLQLYHDARYEINPHHLDHLNHRHHLHSYPIP